MPLVTVFTQVLPNATLAAAVAHGLYHGGASRTPTFAVVMANQGNTAASLGGITFTWDSTSFTLGNSAAALGITVQVMLKKCHTIEDGPTF